MNLPGEQSMDDLDIATNVKVCKFWEASRVSSLGLWIMTNSDRPEIKLSIPETSVECLDEHFSNQSKITSSPKVNKNRQFGTTLLKYCGNSGYTNEKKLKYQAATYTTSSHCLKEEN